MTGAVCKTAGPEGLLDAVRRERISMDVYCRCHPLKVLRAGLGRLGIRAASELRKSPSGSRIILSGMVIFFHTPPTRSGKRIIFATLEDETGLFDVVIPPRVQSAWGRLIFISEVLTLTGRLHRRGWKGLSMSITMERAWPRLCGSFEEVAARVGASG